jgi:hypothetical protein
VGHDPPYFLKAHHFFNRPHHAFGMVINQFQDHPRFWRLHGYTQTPHPDCGCACSYKSTS